MAKQTETVKKIINFISLISVAELSLSCSVVVVANIWFGLVSFEPSEVRVGFSGSWSSEQVDVLSKRLDLSQLVEGITFSASLDDSCSGALRDLQSANFKLWQSDHSFVVEDFSGNCEDFLSFLVSVGDFDQSGQGNGVSGSSGLGKSLVHNRVEFGFSSSGEELVKLDKQLMVVVGGGGLSVLSEFDSLLFEDFSHAL